MKRFFIKQYTRRMLYVSVVVILTTAFFCSCRSQESITKETIENKTEKLTTIKDSVISNKLYTSEDTTFANEETVIHQVTYDTSKTDSNGNYPIKSITNITKKRASGSKSTASKVSTFTKTQNISLKEKQKTISKKQKTTKTVPIVKQYINKILILITIAVILFICYHFRDRLKSLYKYLHH